MRVHRFGSWHYLVILGCAGGCRDVRSDMWDGLLGGLVFWLLRGLGLSAVCWVERNHGNNHKYQLTGSPHGSLGSGNKYGMVFICILDTLHYIHPQRCILLIFMSKVTRYDSSLQPFKPQRITLGK